MKKLIDSTARVAMSAVLACALVPAPALAEAASEVDGAEKAAAEQVEADEMSTDSSEGEIIDDCDEVNGEAEGGAGSEVSAEAEAEEEAEAEPEDTAEDESEPEDLEVSEEELTTQASTSADNWFTVGTTQSGSITSSRAVQRWRFTLSSSGRVKFKAKSYISNWVNIDLYDSDGNKLKSETCFYNSGSGSGDYSANFDLNKGSYIISFSRGGTGSYSFSTSFTSAGETFPETGDGTNNSMATASSLTFGKKITGLIARNDTKDFYRFTLSKAGTVTFKGTSYIGNSWAVSAYLYLYDSNGKKLQEKSCVNDSTTGRCDFEHYFTLAKGTYYFVVSYNGVGSFDTGTYQFTATFSENRTMTRLYNPWSGEHLYTSSQVEINKCVSLGWRNEGTAWIAPAKSATPVYRLYNKYTGDHHYTTSSSEYEACARQGWTKEGIAWYSDDAKGVPLYRGYNRYVTVGTHHYTTSKSEMNTMVKAGWRSEGVAWYGVK